jgi:nucleoid-associated protein YgaU
MSNIKGKEIKKKAKIKVVKKAKSAANRKKSNKIKIELIPISRKSGEKRKFVFQTNPAFVRIGHRARFQSYDLIHKGTVHISKGVEPDNISWNGTFFTNPARLFTKEVPVKTSNKSSKKTPAYMTPRACKKVLTNWLNKGTVLTLKIQGTGIRYNVTIGSFDCTLSGGYGHMEYNISFTRYRPLKIYTTKEKKTKKNVKPRLDGSIGKHTVVSGDSLSAIAQKYYGSAKMAIWLCIYETNKDVIEAEANKRNGGKGSDRGHWIYPGTVLNIPNLENFTEASTDELGSAVGVEHD